MRPPHASRLALNVCLIIISTAAALTLAEFVVRASYPRFDPSGQIDFPNDIGGGTSVGPRNVTLRQTKNTGDFDVAVRFNDAGFRDGPLTNTRPDDLYAVGDSYTMGWGVEERDRYSNVLARLTGRRVRNLAAPTDLDGYARFLESVRERGVVPRRIILGLCMENDLSDYGARATSRPDDTRLPRWQAKEWLTRRSALYVAIVTAVHGSARLQRLGERAGIISRIQFPVPDSSLISPTVRRVYELVQGYDATVLVIPSRGHWTGSTEERIATRRMHDDLVARLIARNIRVVDPRSSFEADGNPLAYYFVNDPHWNAAGHATAARLLAAM